MECGDCSNVKISMVGGETRDSRRERIEYGVSCNFKISMVVRG
jgi:hypothetical protein